jgi:tetratricopeptide (TPR) repeat protein
MDPQLRRAELFGALRRLMVRASEVRPQVLLFEDLHWMDQATEAFLLMIADSIPTSRVLCLFTYRPGYVHPFGERTYHTRIPLSTLSTSDSMQMAQAMLATEQLPEALQRLISDKAEGNPFFVEEVVKSLQEIKAIRRVGAQYVLTKPIEEIVIPDTIQDVLMARIDRLDEAPKHTLQLATVIGREFTHRLLSRLAAMQERTEAFLQELKAIELIYETSRYPELAYMFKHALTQDVAYHSLLVQRRRDLHRLIGQAIEELYTDRLSEQYEVLAYHFAHGEVWDKAFDYFCKAAEKAVQAFAAREAITLYTQALETSAHLGSGGEAKTLIAIHQAKANLYFALSDFERSRAESECALDLARQAGDRESEGAALASMGWASTFAHDFDQALTYAHQAFQVVEEVGAKPVLTRYHLTMAHGYGIRSGQLEQAKEEIDQALTISRSVGDVFSQSFSLTFAGLFKNWEGLYDAALSLLSEGVMIAREHHLLVPLIYGCFRYGITLTSKGAYDEALATMEEGLALAEKAGDVFTRLRLLNSLGWLYFELGDLKRALDFNSRSAEGARERRDPEITANAYLNLADIALAQGDLPQAQMFLDRVYHIARDPATSDWLKWRYSIHLYASLGEFWLARGDPDKAQGFTDQCLEVAMRTNSQKYVVKGRRLQGEIALARRQWEEAEGWLRQALALAQAVGNPTQIWKTHVAMGRLHAAVQQPEKAQQAYQAARDVIERIKMRLSHPELRASLEGSPLVQGIYELSMPD